MSHVTYERVMFTRLGEFVSVHTNEKQQTVSISCDSGRVCRPLIIVSEREERESVCDSARVCRPLIIVSEREKRERERVTVAVSVAP